MALSVAAESLWVRVSERIAETMGLSFPPERWPDLQRGLGRAASEFGCVDAAECGEWILSRVLTRPQIQVLAGHLTVGETYFFRDRKIFDSLASTVLPKLVHARREHDRRLRIWSAACCTGEEPYSLAILLSQIIPDLDDWRVTILATDINERFLQKAAAGVYGAWSFRETPPEFRERYFRRTPKGEYAILPEIKQRVTFACLNLVEDVFPSLATDTNAMDLIFCRNVLMYFTPPQVQKVIGNLRRSLLDDGWLVVSPSETSQALFSRFATVNLPGVILYRKAEVKPRVEPTWPPPPRSEPRPFIAPVVETPAPPSAEPPAKEPAPSVPPSPAVAAQLYEEGDYARAAEILLADFPPQATSETYSLLTRALANQGRLTEALAWCDRWIGADKLDAAGQYLRAIVLQELGDREQARLALQRAVYLQPRLVLAHFALGNLARGGDRAAEADKHFSNALVLLRDCVSDEPLPESDGLTAGRLKEIITSLLAMETAA